MQEYTRWQWRELNTQTYWESCQTGQCSCSTTQTCLLSLAIECKNDNKTLRIVVEPPNKGRIGTGALGAFKRGCPLFRVFKQCIVGVQKQAFGTTKSVLWVEAVWIHALCPLSEVPWLCIVDEFIYQVCNLFVHLSREASYRALYCSLNLVLCVNVVIILLFLCM